MLNNQSTNVIITDIDNKNNTTSFFPVAFILDQHQKPTKRQQQQQSKASYPGDAFFIHGGQSKFVRHAYMDTIASYFPNHMLTTIRGAGHWVHAEAPDDTIALLKRFLDR